MNDSFNNNNNNNGGSATMQLPEQVDAAATTTAAATTAATCVSSATSPAAASAARRPDFQMGDHVYRWCPWAGIPAVYQHHAIVLDVFWWEPAVVVDEALDRGDVADAANADANDDADHAATIMVAGCEEEKQGRWMLTLADFATEHTDAGERYDLENHEPSGSDSSGSGSREEDAALRSPQHKHESNGRIRVYNCPVWDPSNKSNVKINYNTNNTNNDSNSTPQHSFSWHKVVYHANFWQRHLWHRGGTCTAASNDAPGLIRARVEFLIHHPTHLPPYQCITSNGECFAVWCSTGTAWATLQASSLLALVSAGQIKSAATLAGAVSATQVTVPSAGVWGWLGYTTHVSLVSTQPYLLPAIATYGILTAGAPALWLARTQRTWQHWSEQLNEAFWEDAVAQPDVFVECLTAWSAQYEVSSSDADVVELQSVMMDYDHNINNDTTATTIATVATTETDEPAKPGKVEVETPSPQTTGQTSEEGDPTIVAAATQPQIKLASVLMV